MNIYCPYVNLQYATELSIRLEAPDAKFVYTGNSEKDYYNLVSTIWSKKKTFIIVEHDIVPWPGALKSIYECSYWLCAYEAPMGAGIRGYGCYKYSQELMKLWPDHIETIDQGRRSWKILDQGLNTRLLDKGISPHFHVPMVGHLNPDRFPQENLISRR